MTLQTTPNPAIEAWIASLPDGAAFGQVRVRPTQGKYELRHVLDQASAETDLGLRSVGDLRELARYTASGKFRPLKSAPDLRRGWRTIAADATQLAAALNHLYPGALADWYAARSFPPPITDFRAFVGRQSGIYRVAQTLGDAQAAAVIRSCCDPRACLKRRLWSVSGLPPDAREEKSLIPCLEPCARMLEFARKAARTGQGSTETEDSPEQT